MLKQIHLTQEQIDRLDPEDFSRFLSWGDPWIYMDSNQSTDLLPSTEFF
jgi:hypothetical protein